MKFLRENVLVSLQNCNVRTVDGQKLVLWESLAMRCQTKKWSLFNDLLCVKDLL